MEQKSTMKINVSLDDNSTMQFHSSEYINDPRYPKLKLPAYVKLSLGRCWFSLLCVFHILIPFFTAIVNSN